MGNQNSNAKKPSYTSPQQNYSRPQSPSHQQPHISTYSITGGGSPPPIQPIGGEHMQVFGAMTIDYNKDTAPCGLPPNVYRMQTAVGLFVKCTDENDNEVVCPVDSMSYLPSISYGLGGKCAHT